MEKPTKTLTDLPLIAYLVCEKQKFIRTNRVGKKVEFVFMNSPTLEKLILTYFNRQATVDPQTFSDVFRNLKSLCWKSEWNMEDGK